MDLLSRYDSILQKLESIAAIQSGQYWNTTQQQPQTPGIMTIIYRTIYTSECREYNLQDIKTTYEVAFNLIEYLHSVDDDTKVNKLLYTVINSIDSITNLKTVYHSSQVTKNEIDRIYAWVVNTHKNMSS